MNTTKERSPKEMERIRNLMVRFVTKELGLVKKNEPLGDVITCDKCDAKTTCPSAYDFYNTDGDCLEDK